MPLPLALRRPELGLAGTRVGGADHGGTPTTKPSTAPTRSGSWRWCLEVKGGGGMVIGEMHVPSCLHTRGQCCSIGTTLVSTYVCVLLLIIARPRCLTTGQNQPAPRLSSCTPSCSRGTPASAPRRHPAPRIPQSAAAAPRRISTPPSAPTPQVLGYANQTNHEGATDRRARGGGGGRRTTPCSKK